MRKRNYLTPEIQVVKLETESTILTGSVGAGGIDPTRPGKNYSLDDGDMPVCADE